MLVLRNASPGYWACFLLPAAIYFSDIKYNSHSFVAMSIMLTNTVLLIIVHGSGFSLSEQLRKLKSLHLSLSVLTIVYCVLRDGTAREFYEYVSYVALNFTFPYAFVSLMKTNPHSFTFAEGIIVTSAFSYNFWVGSQNLPYPPLSIEGLPEGTIISYFVQLLFFSALLASRFILMAAQNWKIYELEEMFCLWAKCCLAAFIFRLNYAIYDIWFFVRWPVEFLFANPERVTLLIYWTTCLCLAIGVVVFKNFRGGQATSIDRKYFHFLMVAVYVPGILKDFDLIYFCSSVVLFVFIQVETARVLKFEILGLKIGAWIDEQVTIFRDYQDEGSLILTPIYLLVGCSLPIWLTGLYSKEPLVIEPEEISAALCGILSIGVGDTFASIGGGLYGRRNWAGSKKTLEGTACSILSQLLFISSLIVMGLLPYTSYSVMGLTFSIVINALVEAKTDQIDNIIVPLVAFNAIHAFKYLVNYFSS